MMSGTNFIYYFIMLMNIIIEHIDNYHNSCLDISFYYFYRFVIREAVNFHHVSLLIILIHYSQISIYIIQLIANNGLESNIYTFEFFCPKPKYFG